MELGNLYIEKLMKKVLDLTQSNLQLETQLQFTEFRLKEVEEKLAQYPALEDKKEE